MKFNDKVAIYAAIGAKRGEYIENWLVAHGNGRGGDQFWAERIQGLNDAEIALRNIIEAVI